MTTPRIDAAVSTRGVGAGTGAGLLWGLAFVLPDLVPGWTATTITAGRYVAYGVVSVVLFGVIATRSRTVWTVLRRHWAAATLYAVTGNVGYYLLVVLGIQAAGAAVTTLIIGCVPVAVAIASNALDRRLRWRPLLLPVALVLAGLVVVSGRDVLSAPSASVGGTVVGIAIAFCAMCVWTTYGVGNARFLAAHPEVAAGSWSTVVGVVTGAVAVALLPVAALTGQLGRAEPAAAGAAPGWLPFLAVALVLGVVVSWGGTWLWNDASTRLPTSLAGMLVVVETVSGYGYGFLLRLQGPPWVQLVGVAAILAGVVLAVRVQARARRCADQPTSADASPESPSTSRSKESCSAGPSASGRAT